jgi:hypothetical protein
MTPLTCATVYKCFEQRHHGTCGVETGCDLMLLGRGDTPCHMNVLKNPMKCGHRDPNSGLLIIVVSQLEVSSPSPANHFDTGRDKVIEALTH